MFFGHGSPLLLVYDEGLWIDAAPISKAQRVKKINSFSTPGYNGSLGRGVYDLLKFLWYRRLNNLLELDPWP